MKQNTQLHKCFMGEQPNKNRTVVFAMFVTFYKITAVPVNCSCWLCGRQNDEGCLIYTKLTGDEAQLTE